jgi:Predicted membrane protein
MDNSIRKYKNKSYEILLLRIVIALAGVALVGFGLAFNLVGKLGNDPVAVLYDGARNVLGFPPEKLGLVTNLVNCGLIAIIFILGRKYLNIGTIIYAVPMGSFISIGFKLHDMLNIPTTLGGRILTSFCGCSMLFLGVGIFIAVDIGMDPCTGIVMLIRDKINRQYRVAKIISDVCSLTLGFAFGGKVGAVTVIAAIIAGPTIQKVSEVFKNSVLKRINLAN